MSCLENENWQTGEDSQPMSKNLSKSIWKELQDNSIFTQAKPDKIVCFPGPSSANPALNNLLKIPSMPELEKGIPSTPSSLLDIIIKDLLKKGESSPDEGPIHSPVPGRSPDAGSSPKPPDITSPAPSPPCAPGANLEGGATDSLPPSPPLPEQLNPGGHGQDTVPSPFAKDKVNDLLKLIPPPENCKESVEELANALLSGDVGKIQELLKSVKTNEDMETLKGAVDYINSRSKDVKPTLSNLYGNGAGRVKPVLDIRASYFSNLPGCGNGHSSHDLRISGDSVSAVLNSGVGYLPKINVVVEPGQAMKGIKSTLESQGFSSYFPADSTKGRSPKHPASSSKPEISGH